jgi:hypothetical protein
MANDLTYEAMLGYSNHEARSPFLATSNSSDAWHIGAWLRQTGRSAPREVRKSRGYTFHVNDMKVQVKYLKGQTEIERIT